MIMVDDHQQKIALGIVVAFPILGGIAILLRLWSRYLSRLTLASGKHLPFDCSIDGVYCSVNRIVLTGALDDYLIVAGYILAVSQSVTSWYCEYFDLVKATR